MTEREERLEIAKAFAAIQEHVLPGLGVAWDTAGPATLLVAEHALAQLWVDSGFPLEDFLDMARAVTLPQLFPSQMRPILIGDGGDDAD
jgi:hypothetical protein